MISDEPAVLQAIRDLTRQPAPDYPEATAWTARICRLLNGLPENPDSVAYCGLCRDYANPRKRARAGRLPLPLPGFERTGGGFALHDPCPRLSFRALRHTLKGLEIRGVLIRARVKIPDTRTPKGWDYASNYRIVME